MVPMAMRMTQGASASSSSKLVVPNGWQNVPRVSYVNTCSRIAKFNVSTPDQRKVDRFASLIAQAVRSDQQVCKRTVHQTSVAGR